MESDKEPQQEQTPQPLEQTTPPEKKPSEPYSRKMRILAWLGVAFMVFLVIMYTYSLATGKIMEW